MKKLLHPSWSLLVILMLLSGSIMAQPYINTGSGKGYRETPVSINDLVDTKLDVRFDYQRSYLYGKAWITLKPHFYNTDSLTLDAKGMDVHKIAIAKAGKLLPLRYTYEDSAYLHIKLDKKYAGGEQYTVFIDYTSKPNLLHDKPGHKLDGKGLYFINPKGTEADKPTQVWTQGEAEASSCWFPTIDRPGQKTTQQLSMTVPAKYTTLSNGLLIGQKNNADGTRTDTWKQKLPHSPYLFMMAIGDFKIYKDKWRNKEVNYYLEPKYFPYAKAIFGQTPEMMEFYSKALGVDFPWEKYSQVVVRDYPLGAMENSSATLHGDYVQKSPWDLVDDPNGSGGSTIAHELFHQWFGDLVTCESWSNETLNESFAVFGEKYWQEKKYGKDDGDAKRYDELQAYLNNKTALSQNLVPFYYSDEEGINGSNIYDKGGIVLNMMRTYLGDAAFFKGLGLYLKTHSFKSAEVHDLRLAMEEVSGRDMNWFFNQWYYGAGHPVLDITYKWDESSKTEKVFISQNQQGQVFILPIAVDIYTGSKVERHNVWLRNAKDTLTFKLAAKPNLVNVDAEKILLAKKTDHKTMAEYAFQYQHATLYMDRFEAFQAATEQVTTAEGKQIMIAALRDKYYGLRIKAIRAIKTDDKDLMAAALPVIASLAKADEPYPVRAAAISFLAKTEKAAGFKDIYISSLKSPSYSVRAAALNALNGVAPAEAFKTAKDLQPQADGPVALAIVGIYAANGSDTEWPYVITAFKKAPVQAKVDNAIKTMPKIIGKMNNRTYVAEGIDAIRDLAVNYKRYGIAPRLITSLEEISKQRKQLNDDTSAKLADDAIRQVKDAK
ncbi:M1 family peptidase [Mucilaginibacter pallidiroseus]|uniref:Aminopeptidase N n=1 Tax=Mucilaginibacter pallidiroseus TaxID=2599295 RepID=A0A563U0F0_9SPHI|nr:M1 family aminopeptidase [Mucilaginibacter pallidiroseus]TWR25107.1 M1 family peptidase [Mucilaginibacter pallidiroseus]